MPPFTFKFPATSPSGKPAPTKAHLVTYEKVFRGLLNATTLSLSFTDNGDDTGVFTVTGTADNLGDLEEKIEETIDSMPPMAGWVASGPIESSGEPGDPEAHDEDPRGGRRRRRRKTTRRHRKRKTTRRR